MFSDICRIITILACCAAAFELFDSMVRSSTAPQQAAGAAMAAAMVIIPYVFTRMVESMAKSAAAEKTGAAQPAKMF